MPVPKCKFCSDFIKEPASAEARMQFKRRCAQVPSKEINNNEAKFSPAWCPKRVKPLYLDKLEDR